MKKTNYMMMLLSMTLLVYLTGCSNSAAPIETTPSVFESTSAFQNESLSETLQSEDLSSKGSSSETSVSETTDSANLIDESTSEADETISGDKTESGKTVTQTTAPEETKPAVPVILQGYLFEAGGIQIGMHEYAEGVLAALGDADAYYETPSCAFQGMDKQDTEGGYMLKTYEDQGLDYVYDIYFLDESVSTPEGIHIGSTVEEMIGIYGDGYTEDFGMYIYVKERSKLQFLVMDGVITSVDYTAVTD